MMPTSTIDPAEVERFSRLAQEWWDPEGPFAPLHRINPLRIRYVRDRLCARFGRDAGAQRPLAGLSVIDIGCGGGLIAEPLTRLGACVTGIDASERNIAIAADHAAGMGLDIDYRTTAAETLAESGARYDAVLALEVIEHVADRDVFLAAVARMVKPGGCAVLATLNRTPQSFLFAIVGAEYILGWLPRGTHSHSRFVRPSELAAGLRRHGLGVEDLTGMSYEILSGAWRLGDDLAVNYMATAARD